MARSSDVWERARAQAEGYLRRFTDPWTRSHCDDLVQETAMAAWRWSSRPHDPKRFWAAVRTIARRVRGHTRRLDRRSRAAASAAVAERDVGEPTAWELEIGGRRVTLASAKELLATALVRLPAVDHQLLIGFHEGFCCAELAIRFGRSVECIKTRIHRARRRVRRDIEASVRAADGLDVL